MSIWAFLPLPITDTCGQDMSNLGLLIIVDVLDNNRGYTYL